MCSRETHIVNLLITREDDDDRVRNMSVSSILLDHFLIGSEVSLERHPLPTTSVLYRNYRLTDTNVFLLQVKSLPACNESTRCS